MYVCISLHGKFFGSSKLQLIETYFNWPNIQWNEVYYIYRSRQKIPGICTNFSAKIVIFKQLYNVYILLK